MTYVCKNRVQVFAQGRILKVKVPHTAPTKPVVGIRGEIQEFSPQSRKRMLDKLARIDFENAGFVCFLTLTYPDRNGPPSHKETERDRRTFFKRMARRFPESSAIWRREHEARKTGEFRGEEFPHYHMMFFGLPFFEHEALNEIWREVIGYEGYVRTEIKGLENWKQAMYYLSKYMAKTQQQRPGSGGATPSEEASGMPETPADGEADRRSLVYVTYMTGEEIENGEEENNKKNDTPERIGRSWGVFHRKLLPMAEEHSASVPAGEWLWDAKDAAADFWPGINSYPGLGFTLYTPGLEKSAAWFHEICERAYELPEPPDDGIPF